MYSAGYLLIWIVLIVLPVVAAWKKQWWACGIYVLGCLIFLFSTLRDQSGWEDLAAIATLLVVVGPIYLLGTIIWLSSFIRRKRKSN